MPITDMPLEQLKRYTGSSPCPKDINAFWDEAISEMKAVNADVELIPANFTTGFAECFHLYFNGVGGARIYAKYARPAKRHTQLPILLNFHGYRLSSCDWTGLLPYAAEGFHIAALDCRGQAGRSSDNAAVTGNTLDGHIIRGLADGPASLYFRSVFLDTAQLAHILTTMPDTDANRIGCFGASQGGALALACAALEPRIKRAAALYPFLCDYRRAWEVGAESSAYSEIQNWFKTTDPLHEHEEEFFSTLGYIDIQNIAPRIQARVLMMTGLMDTLCPPSTQFATYGKIRSPKEMLVYPDYGHEDLRLSGDKIFEFMRGLKDGVFSETTHTH